MWTNQAVIESRLKEMGYSDKDAAVRAKKIYDSSHFGNGGGARAASLGYQQRKGGFSAFTLDGGMSNQGYVNEQLEIMKNNLSVYKMNEENRAKLAEAQKATNQPTETHKHIFELANKRVEVQVPSHQSHDLNDMLRQLEIAKRSSM